MKRLYIVPIKLNRILSNRFTYLNLTYLTFTFLEIKYKNHTDRRNHQTDPNTDTF